MTSSARGIFMFSLEYETSLTMIERCRVKTNDGEISAVMFAVTFRAVVRTDRCVVAFVIPDPRLNFLVTTQAL
jgi:hypothetical protein